MLPKGYVAKRNQNNWLCPCEFEFAVMEIFKEKGENLEEELKYLNAENFCSKAEVIVHIGNKRFPNQGKSIYFLLP